MPTVARAVISGSTGATSQWSESINRPPYSENNNEKQQKDEPIFPITNKNLTQGTRCPRLHVLSSVCPRGLSASDLSPDTGRHTLQIKVKSIKKINQYFQLQTESLT